MDNISNIGHPKRRTGAQGHRVEWGGTTMNQLLSMSFLDHLHKAEPLQALAVKSGFRG